MANEIHQYGNFILNVPNKRGVTKKGIPLIYKDTQEPSGYILSKTTHLTDNDTLFLELTERQHDLNHLTDEKEVFLNLSDALTLSRKYALEHNKNLWIDPKTIHSYKGNIIGDINVNNLQVPMMFHELKKIAETERELKIIKPFITRYVIPENLKMKIEVDLRISLELSVKNNGKFIDDFSNISLENDKKYNIVTHDNTMTLHCNTAENLKLPKWNMNNSIKEISLEGDSVILTDKIKQIKKEKPHTEITIENLSPCWIDVLYKKNRRPLESHIDNALQHIKETHPDLDIVDYVNNLKTFYVEQYQQLKDNTDTKFNVEENAKIPANKLKRIQEINEQYNTPENRITSDMEL